MILLSLGWNIGISIIAVMVVLYAYIVYFSLSSIKKFEKKLSSAEISIKLSCVETITLTKKMCKIVSQTLTLEEQDLIDDIENKIAINKIFGAYKKVSSMFVNRLNIINSQELTEEQSTKIAKIQFFQKEIDGLYQKALFSYNSNLLGYNYWVKFILTRVFTKILKLNKKDELY